MIDMLARDERASDAKELLDHPLLTEIIQHLIDEATATILANPPGSEVGLMAHHRVLAVRAIQADLVRLVEDPKMLLAAVERRRRFAQ